MSDTDYMLALTQQFQIQIEELLKYDQLRDIKQRQFVCQYWLRGTCCFTPDFCHFAHGIKYLHYTIDSMTELKPLPSAEDVKLKYKINGFPKQYFVAEKFQQDPQVQEQLKQYCNFVGKVYDPCRKFTLREIKYERSIKPIILNTLQLNEVQQFYLKILESLQVDVIPKALFIHELNRVGYSYMGSHFARPNTLIFHLGNTGICFQKSLSSDIVLKGFDDSFMRKQLSLKVLKGQQDDEKQKPDEENEDDEAAGDDVEEEAEEITQNPPETQEGIKTIPFIIRVRDRQELIANFTKFLQETLMKHPEFAKLTDIDDFSFAISEYIEAQNQLHFEQKKYIIPYLEQFLRLIDKIWDEYANEYGFSHIKFVNSRESGIPVELIMKNFTPEQKLELENYLAKPKIKYYLCQYWLRGICIFQKKNCRFAHGLEDLEINFDIKRDFANLDKEQRPLRYNQKPLINHRTYRILYLHQYTMIEDGDLKYENKGNQFQIDNIKEYRDKIREHIQRRMIINLFRKVSNGQPQSKGEIMKYFSLVGFVQRGVDLSELKIIKILLNSDIVFEKEVVKKDGVKKDIQKEIILKEAQNEEEPNDGKQDELSKKDKKKATQKQLLLIPVKDYKQYDQFYEDIIFKGLINIFQNKVNLPIEESQIKKEIYKYDQVLEMPGLYQYFLRNPQKKYTFIDYFQECILGQAKTRLKDKIHPEVYQQIQDDGLNLIQFEADIASLMLIIEALYGSVESKQQAAINFEKVIKQIEMKASDNDKQNSLLNYFVKDKKHLIIAINGVWYVHNQNAIVQVRQKQCKCGSTYSQPSQIKPINENILITKIIDAQQLVDKDVRHTIIIDSPEKLLFAQDFLSQDVNYIAIDLEGNLRKGDIWLVQMGIIAQKSRIIFIFDLMRIKYLEADLLFHGQMLSVVKQVIEDPNICKVFHDCKRDSQALHLNGICPKNIVDTSCTYQLLEYLRLNNQQGLKKSKTTIQIAKEILQVATPPINSVLTKYGALHGGNELKEEMHAKFKHPQGEEFFARPNPAFMYYSARDVEDLVQVYLEMESKAPQLRYIIEKMSHKNKEFFVQKPVQK